MMFPPINFGRDSEDVEPSPLAMCGRSRVTVCIAAFSDQGRRIGMVADSRVAFGDFSTDQGAIKYEHLGAGYLAMIAGNDIVYASGVIQKARSRIESEKTYDPDRVSEILQEELFDLRCRLIDAKVLKRYKMNVDDFAAKGKRAFTEQVFGNLCAKIEKLDISLKFLVLGYDLKDKPHLRVVTVDDSPHDFDALGFVSIGTGAPAAMASLSFARDHLGFGHSNETEQSAYHLLAAKFMAESATDVGQDTFFMSLGDFRVEDRVRFINSFGCMDSIRESWRKNGAPKHSKKTIGILKDVMYATRL